MKSLNQFEKTVLNEVLSYNRRGIAPNVASILDAFLVHKSIKLDYTTRHVEIYLERTAISLEEIVDEARNTTRELVTALSFLSYLNEAGYLVLYNESALPPKFEFGQRIRSNPVISAELHDEGVKDLLFTTFFQTILVTQSLLDYVANGYQTPDDLHKKIEQKASQSNLKLALIALVFSTVFSLIGTVLGAFSLYYATKEIGYAKMQVEQDQNVRLVDNQAKAMEKAFTDITVQLDSVTRKLDSLLAHTPPSQTPKPAGVGKGKPVTSKKENNKKPVPANSATAE